MIKKVVSLLLWSGTSSAATTSCADYERKQADGSCAADKCDWNLQIKQKDGTCKACAECTRPAQGSPIACVAGGNWPKSGCVAGKATTPTQCPADSILTTAGCYKCNRGKPDAAQKKCLFTLAPAETAPKTPKQPTPTLTPSGGMIVGTTQCGWNEVVDQRGVCYPCPANQIPDANRRVCLRQNLPVITSCYYNQIRTASGCMTCRVDTVPDAQHRACLRQTSPPVRNCYFNQISSANGCLNCPGNLIPDASHTVCLRQDPGQHNPSFSCAYNQIITVSGCQTCGGGLVPDAAHRNCLRQSNPPPPPPPVCTSNQILTSSGCVTCGPMLVPDAARRNCLRQDPPPPVTCPRNQIRVGNNMCAFCQVDTTPDASQTRCLRINRPPAPAPAPVICNDRQVRSASGGCVDCPRYTKAQSNGQCAADSCGANQVVSVMGTCVICGAGQTPSPSGRSCVMVVAPPVVARANCNDREQISSDGRYCVRCQSYTRAQNNNQFCAGDSCNSSNEILLPTGLCGRCPANSDPDANRKQCIRRKANCGSKERLSNDQRSCIPCPQYTRAQNQNTRCAADSCYSNQVVTSQGTCSVCPAGQEPDAARRSCVDKISCGSRERLSGNSCIPCETWTRAQDGNTYCAADACSGNQKVTGMGMCQECPAYTIVSSDRRTCATPQCTGRAVLESDGTCRQCLPYSKPDASRRNCIADTCDPNSKSTSDGGCEACMAGYQVTADGRFCELKIPAPRPPPPPASDVRTCGYTEGRMKDVSLVSISPLDRLLNQNDKADSVLVKVGCAGTNGKRSAEYGFDMTKDSVNQITCHNGGMPGANEVCTSGERLACGPGQPYQIEMFDRAAQKAQGLASPPSLGKFEVTRQMMECMVEDKLQVHFQFGKRQALSGAVACFDHVEYIRTGRRANAAVEIQDEIPFTTLNICHKNSKDSKRCFVYGYQVTILVTDSDRNPAARYPMLEPKVYAKISFNQILSKMVILPGDQVGVRFGSDYTPGEGLRMSPNIDDPSLPSPMKERYQVVDSSGAVSTRLPCNDMKVADTVTCDNFVAYCTGPEDRITLSVQGAGSVFLIDQTCKDFFANDEDWNALQAQLNEDVSKFNANFQDDQGNAKEFKISKVSFQNKRQRTVASEGEFFFTYTLGWRFSSKEPCCFAGDHLKHENPTCRLQCATSQCLLESLKPPNQDSRRMLQAADNMAGPDVAPRSYVQATLPLEIPTTTLDLRQPNVPERLLQIFLANYRNPQAGASRRQNSIVGEFEEGVEEPINLSAEFYEDIGPAYEYDVTDKLEVASQPPAYIKVTKTPKHGNIVVKQFGKQVVLSEGDVVQASLFKGFTYDQGHVACSSKAQDKCQDSFSYVAFSEWVGKGQNQESIININPVTQGVAIASGLSATPLESATGQPAQISKKVTDVKSTTCSDEYPVVLVAWLGVAVVSVMVALSFALVKVKQVMNEASGEEEEIEIKSDLKAPRRESHVPLANSLSAVKQESVEVPLASPKDEGASEYATKANVTAPKLSEELEGSIGTADFKQNGSKE